MSFVSLNKTFLQNALTLANQVSPKKNEIDIFTFTKCEIKNNTLVISSLQSHAFFQTSVVLDKNELGEDITFLIKTDQFAGTTATITDDVVTLEVDTKKHTLIIAGAKSKHTLRIETERVQDFTVPQEKPDELIVKLKIPTDQLVRADKMAFTTVGLPKNVSQTAFHNICYTVLPQATHIKVVSCDQFRISKTTIDTELEHTSPDFSEEGRNFLIPPKCVQLLHACITSDGEISFNFEKSLVWVHLENSTLALRYGEGAYPNYEQIIPMSYTCHFVANSEDLRLALKQVYLTARTNVINKSLTMKVEPKNQKLLFSSQSDDGFASESVVDLISYEGIVEEWSQSFNTDYLLDFITHVITENTTFDANPGKPMVMSPEGKKEQQICMIQGLR